MTLQKSLVYRFTKALTQTIKLRYYFLDIINIETFDSIQKGKTVFNTIRTKHLKTMVQLDLVQVLQFIQLLYKFCVSALVKHILQVFRFYIDV